MRGEEEAHPVVRQLQLLHLFVTPFLSSSQLKLVILFSAFFSVLGVFCEGVMQQNPVSVTCRLEETSCSLQGVRGQHRLSLIHI